jgi:hypothetical protein
MISLKDLSQMVTDEENRPHQTGKMVWNGNEIVFENYPNIGIAGVPDGMPDEFAEELVRRWNLQD